MESNVMGTKTLNYALQIFGEVLTILKGQFQSIHLSFV